MKKIWALILREWKNFFHTPFAVIIVPLYLILCGTYFYAKLDQYMNMANPNETVQKVAGLNVTIHLLTPFFKDLINVLTFIIPLLTMRSFSEEKKMGTYDLLVSYPLRPWEILLGKYLGSVSLVLFLLGISLIFPAVIFWKGEPYLPQVLSTYLGYVLFIFFYVAVGVVGSLLTENQIVAAIISYGVFFAAILIQWLAYISGAPWDRFFSNFLLVAHLDSFRTGLIFVGDIAAYLCITSLFLLCGYLKLKQHFSQ